ncbi:MULTISPECIES: D-alanyl-D-alanine carboxypeptidase family protein [unclassified Ruminococcus]|uniref:D-alanyl-D-alanine carboxypeptidase family protein n=1 Tax=unclassified Ruminococcus TaxID=2608920 RepID=UPI00210C7AE7|nr:MULTISPECIES: D-alanyl-D-alanine carboxypeptidase family protein [unclassified Ruminococcus]MCQ4021858.1 D-alanyl-D-alanine carboxypeptidase [Ruminococcus sp. zg-924]MCQ4114303.1 D-alanyl-D-alanine carboxypeptidase [Ruminococcus sp. zg-921]
MRKKLSKGIAFVLTFVILSTMLMLNASAAGVSFDPQLDLNSDYIYLVNLDTDTTIFQKDADKKCYPASTTKIMTYVIVTEKVKDLENTMVTIKQSVLDQLEGTDSSVSGLAEYVDEKISVLELLYCMMVPSGNDAALVLADYISDGNVPEFVKLMNQKAKELGCDNTNFVNPHGLHDENHYTTARDMFKIAEYAITTPRFTDITNTVTYHLSLDEDDENPIITTNYMINENSEGDYYYEYAKGIKTGTTDEAGYCLVSSAVQDGVAYMCVAMHSPCYDDNGDYRDNGAMLDSKALYEWAFSNMELQQVVAEQTPVCEVKINYAMDKDTLMLVPQYAYSTMLPIDKSKDDIVIKSDVPEVIDTPVSKGTVVGTATIYYKDQELTKINLVASETIEKSELVYAMTVIKNVVTSPIFIIAAAFVIVLFAAYLIFVARLNKGKGKDKEKVNKPRDL